jgi:hypothetical protein
LPHLHKPPIAEYNASKKQEELSMKKQKEENTKHWESHILKWQRNSISRKEYCRRENISYWTFCDRIKKQEAGRTRKLVKLPQETYPWTDNAESGIEIRTENKISIQIKRGFDGELLRELIAELGVEK